MTAFHISLPLRWSDLDPQGHVNNVTLLDLAQEARARMMIDSACPQLLVDGTVMVHQRVEYLAALDLEGPVEIEIGTTSVGTARFVMSYRIHRGEKDYARAETIMCPFDFASQSLRHLAPDEKDYLNSLAVEEGESWRRIPTPHLRKRGIATQLPARWSDQDRYGHVNNVRLLDWLQQARIESTAAMDPSMNRAGMGTDTQDRWLVVRQDIDYVQQLQWRLEPYLAYTAPMSMGRSSVTLACEITDPDDDSVHVKARTVLVHADASGKSTPLPPSAASALEALQIDDDHEHS